MTKLGRIIIACLVVVALIGGALLFTSRGNDAKNDVLRIGFVGPLSGGSFEIGEPIKNAITLAISELNAQGKRIELYIADDACDPKQGGIELQKLIDVDRVSFVIGGVCNDEALALAAVAEQEKVILMVPTVSTQAVSLAGDFIFRNTQPDFQGGALLGDYAGQKAKTISIVSDSAEEATAYHNAFVDAFVAKGGTVVDDETHNAKFPDVKRQVTRMKNVKPAPQAVFMNLRDQKTVAAYLDEMKLQGLRLPIYGYTTVAGLANDAKYKVQLQGLVIAEAPRLDPAHPKAAELSKRGVDAYNAAGYEAAMLFAEGYEKGAKSGEAMRDFLYGVKAYEGVQGTYEFDARGDMVGVPFILKVVKNGKLELVK